MSGVVGTDKLSGALRCRSSCAQSQPRTHVVQVLQGRAAGEAEGPAHAAGGPPEGRAASQASMAAAAAEAQVTVLERKARPC